MKHIIVLFCLFLCGCQTALDLPKPVEHQEVAHVPVFQDLRPIQFTKAIFDIPGGQLYAVYPYWRASFPNVHIGIWSCNLAAKYRWSRSEHHWEPGTAPLSKWNAEDQDCVEQALMAQGYDVISTHKRLFGGSDARMRAELQLGARIIDLKMNVCHLYNGLTWGDLNAAGGSAYVKVEWEVYDPLQKKSLGTIVTDGIGYVDEPLEAGSDLLVLEALKQAAADLGRTQKFYQMVSRSKTPERLVHYARLDLESDIKPYKTPIKENYNTIRRAALVVRTSLGHGSGFFVNREGYALTNAHVVGDAKTVAVRDSLGTTMMADVIRVNKVRDVALLKVSVRDNPAMALNLTQMPKPLDRVYSLGAPLKESNKQTVSEGIVSHTRTQFATQNNLIQASVPVAMGSSGGALLDEFGNVIGLCVSKISKTDTPETDFGLFIPIQDALDALHIVMVKPTY